MGLLIPIRCRYLCALAAVGLLVGCSPGSEADQEPTRSDEGEDWVPWVIDSVPTVVIGDGGGSEYDLASVRSAQRFSAGYVVATAQPEVIRTYDAAGRFIRSIGRAGEGPGEFRAINGMWVTEGDTIVVADQWQQRITYFDSDGTLIRTVRHEPGGSYSVGDSRPRLIKGRFADGSFLSVQEVTRPPPQDLDAIVTGSDRYFREIPDRGLRGLIVERASTEQAFNVGPGEPISLGFWGPVPFTPSTAFTTVDSLLVLADSRRFELEFWSMDGQKVGAFAKEYEVQPLTDEIWEGELDRRLKAFTDRIESNGNRQGLNVQSELAWIRRRFQGEARLPTIPAHGTRMLASPAGDIWLEAWAGDMGQRSSTWHVFLAKDQRFVGAVELPARFRPTAIYEDAVLGVQRDEWDVETVQEYRIHR